MEKYLITFLHHGTIRQRIVEAASCFIAKDSVDGFVLSCITLKN